MPKVKIIYCYTGLNSSIMLNIISIKCFKKPITNDWLTWFSFVTNKQTSIQEIKGLSFINLRYQSQLMYCQDGVAQFFVLTINYISLEVFMIEKAVILTFRMKLLHWIWQTLNQTNISPKSYIIWENNCIVDRYSMVTWESKELQVRLSDLEWTSNFMIMMNLTLMKTR